MMANVKERYTQITRDARNGRILPARSARTSSPAPRDNEVAEEERLASTFRRRARADYQTATSQD